jgi:hypothetical protein
MRHNLSNGFWRATVIPVVAGMLAAIPTSMTQPQLARPSIS